MKFFRFICLATAFLLAVSLVWAGGRRDTGDMPQGIHLTWSTNDVYRTMTISWWTEGSTDSAVKYGTRSGTYASEATGIQHQIKTKASTWEHQYHDVELTGLEPGRTYYFVCGGKDGWSKEYKFKTIGLNQQVRFVFGGDSEDSMLKKKRWALFFQKPEGWFLIGRPKKSLILFCLPVTWCTEGTGKTNGRPGSKISLVV